MKTPDYPVEYLREAYVFVLGLASAAQAKGEVTS